MGIRVKLMHGMKSNVLGQMFILGCISAMTMPSLCVAETMPEKSRLQQHTDLDKRQNPLPIRIDLSMTERDWTFPEQNGKVKILPLKVLIHNTGNKPIRLQNGGSKHFFSISMIDPSGRLVTEPLALDNRNDGGRAFSQYETCPTIAAPGYLEAEWEIILGRVDGLPFVAISPKGVRLPVWSASPVEAGEHIIRLYYSGKYSAFNGCWSEYGDSPTPGPGPSPDLGVASSTSLIVNIKLRN